MNNIVSIYTLSDPDIGKVCYVGQTISASARISNHVSDCGGVGRKREWVRSLVESGKEPIMTVVCCVPEEYADQVETAMIQAYRMANPDLFNIGDAPRGGVVARGKNRQRRTPTTVIKTVNLSNGVREVHYSDGYISRTVHPLEPNHD